MANPEMAGYGAIVVLVACLFLSRAASRRAVRRTERTEALGRLVCLGSAALPDLISASQDGDADVRRVASEALHKLGYS